MNPAFSAQRVVGGVLEKRCPKCREWLPADRDFFFANRTATLGLSVYCKPCQTEYVAAARTRKEAIAS